MIIDKFNDIFMKNDINLCFVCGNNCKIFMNMKSNGVNLGIWANIDEFMNGGLKRESVFCMFDRVGNQIIYHDLFNLLIKDDKSILKWVNVVSGCYSIEEMKIKMQLCGYKI